MHSALVGAARLRSITRHPLAIECLFRMIPGSSLKWWFRSKKWHVARGDGDEPLEG